MISSAKLIGRFGFIEATNRMLILSPDQFRLAANGELPGDAVSRESVQARYDFVMPVAIQNVEQAISVIVTNLSAKRQDLNPHEYAKIKRGADLWEEMTSLFSLYGEQVTKAKFGLNTCDRDMLDEAYTAFQQLHPKLRQMEMKVSAFNS